MADRFLIVTKRKVIDTPAVPEVPAVPADPTTQPPTPATPAIPAVVEVSHLEVDQVYVEDSPAQVARNLELPVPNMDAYHLSFSGPDLNASIQPVTIKGGARAPGTGREVVEIEAGGGVVGSAEVDI